MNNTNFGTDIGLGMGVGMWVFWIFLILVVIAIAIARFVMTGSPDTSADSHLQILEKRYASGEINEKEFETMKNELEK